jgi:hypothetical protein
MSGEEPFVVNAVELPAAVVESPQNSDPSSLVHQSFPVRQPEEDIQEFYVRVRASMLRRARAKAAELLHSSFPWDELCLAISTTAAGAFLGSLTAVFAADEKAMKVFFQNILPAIATASFVAYLFLRKSKHVDSARVAKEISDNLPDPAKSR